MADHTGRLARLEQRLDPAVLLGRMGRRRLRDALRTVTKEELSAIRAAGSKVVQLRLFIKAFRAHDLID